MPDHQQHRDARIEAWNRFWSSGAEHSCAASFDLGGSGGLARFWQNVLATLEQEATVVDLGTGNGGLLKLAHEYAVQYRKRWKLIGVDMAQPAPAWLQSSVDFGDRVRILGGTPMESTGLTAHQADLIVSQFGIEYGPAGAIQAECVRLLHPTGRIALVVHHEGSAISRVARDEGIAQRHLLAEDTLLSTAQRLLPHVADIRAGREPSQHAHRVRDDFRLALERTLRLSETLAAPDLLLEAAQGAQQFLESVNLSNLPSLQTMLAEYKEQLLLANLRTEEQLEAAMDAAQLAEFLQPYEAAGFSVITQPIFEDGNLIAWGVEGRRDHG